MSRLRRAAARFAAVFRRRALDRDLDAELAAHIDMAIDDYIESGLSRPKPAARLSFISAASSRHANTTAPREGL